MTISNHYINELDKETNALLQMSVHFPSRLPLQVLPIPVSAVSPDGSNWLHCVEAIKDKKLFRIRVIIKNYRGVTITVYSECPEMYYKFCDLRFNVRNNDFVAVTFPEIYVSRSKYMPNELYLTANDFRLLNPEMETHIPPKPKLII